MKRSDFLKCLVATPAIFLLPKVGQEDRDAPQYGEVVWRHPERKEWQMECPAGDFKTEWCFSTGMPCPYVGQRGTFKHCLGYKAYCTGFAMAEGGRHKDFKRRWRKWYSLKRQRSQTKQKSQF